MTKTYAWEEIKSKLKTELQKTKHILTYGTIGSCNMEHDIDTIITKKPQSSSSDFFREIHNLFDVIDDFLQKKYKARLIRTSRFSDEEETKYIAKFEENDLVFQVLTYTSFKQIKMHWYADLAPNKKVEDIIKSHYSCILGNVDDLFKSDFKINKNEELFIRLNDSDRINSHFPKEFLVSRMNVLFDFILRKRLHQNPISSKSEIEVRKVFYQICDALDK